MTDLWPIRELGAVGVSVLDCEHKTPARAEQGYPYVAIPNLVDGRLSLENVRLISAEDFATWTRRIKPHSGDIIVTRRGRVGDSAVIPDGVSCAIGQNLVILRSTGELVHQAYLRWALRSPHWISEVDRLHNVGAIFDSLNVADIPRMRIPLPPKRSQKVIASVLGALDDKIGVNDRIAHTVYELAQAKFSLSVQHAKLKVVLRDLLDLRYGKALPEDIRERGTVPVFGSNGRSGWHSRPLTTGPGIIIGRKGANAGSVSWSQKPFWVIDTGFFVDVISPSISLEYIYFLLQRVGLKGQVGDSAIPGLSREIALACTAMLPPEDVIRTFVSEARPLLSLRAHMSEESASLALLRDTLLPKLLSGEIRVREAERIVEGAT